MRSKVRWMLFVILLGSALAQPTQGQEIGRLAVGARAGVNATDNDEDFVQTEIFCIYDLPWALNLPWRGVLGSRINGSVGALTGGGRTGFVGTIGPGVFLSRRGGRVVLFAGISPTVLSRDRFGNEDLGGRFHFTSHLGISFRFSQHFGAAYRIQHMSNAGIEKPNPGLDLHVIELRVRF